MSSLHSTLEQTKLELLQKRQQTQGALEKCALPGYITAKNIRGIQTYYLQFRDEHNKMTSVHLSKDKLSLCQSAFEEKERCQQELNAIDDDLHLLSLVEVSPTPGPENSPEIPPARILDNAVGLSPRHKYLFYLTARPQPGEYEIHFFTKKDIHEVSMVFVNEYSVDRISDYIITASCIVDEAADNMAKEKAAAQRPFLPTSGQYHTKNGTVFKFRQNGQGYVLSFFYKRKKYEIDYAPYNEEQKGVDFIELARMGFRIEQFIRVSTFAGEVKKYYERKQNVHTEAQES